MGKQKTAAELRAEVGFLKRSHVSQSIALVLTTGIKWAGLTLMARYLFLVLSALAGKITIADIGIGLLGDVRMSIATSWTLAASGVVYGIRQRHVRKKTIERLQSRIKNLEEKYDSNRSSSGLTTRGNTRPEDE